MATIKSDVVTNKKYFPCAAPHSAREVYVTPPAAVTIPNTLAAGDLVHLAVLPANCLPVDCILASTDLDTGTPAIVVSVGILNAAGDGLVPSSDLISASTIAQAGGVERMTSKENVFAPATWLAEATCPKITAEKIVALIVDTVAATKAAGTMNFQLTYRAVENGK